jgi:hypothetical protein
MELTRKNGSMKEGEEGDTRMKLYLHFGPTTTLYNYMPSYLSVDLGH